jgi:putative sterol carrier protein
MPEAVPAPEFFERLAAERQPLLGGTRGTMRFDVLRGDTMTSWYVRIDHGDVAVSHETSAADAVVRAHEPLFEDIVTGRANAMAAALRGEIGFEGSPQLLTVFQRVFPGPPQRSAS